MVRGVIQRDLMDFRLGSTKLGGRLVPLHGGVLDKSHKIRRYKRKDYTAVVDFPVEIIGRDGVVRRYSFEESIRLYQRRIASADLRYADTELIQAEKQHCLSRIHNFDGPSSLTTGGPRWRRSTGTQAARTSWLLRLLRSFDVVSHPWMLDQSGLPSQARPGGTQHGLLHTATIRRPGSRCAR